jgi:hypothetical protein
VGIIYNYRRSNNVQTVTWYRLLLILSLYFKHLICNVGFQTFIQIFCCVLTTVLVSTVPLCNTWIKFLIVVFTSLKVNN